MARLPALSPLAELQNPSDSASLNQTLRRLKNELIGHQHKKQHWISAGLVPYLRNLLIPSRPHAKRRQRDVNGAPGSLFEGPKAENEEARLQAVMIVGSLASGRRVKACNDIC